MSELNANVETMHDQREYLSSNIEKGNKVKSFQQHVDIGTSPSFCIDNVINIDH